MAAQLGRARARTGRHQRPADRDGVDRHAVRPCQPARIPEPARLRMDEGAAIQQRAVAADDRRRSLQALQRHLRPSRRRRLPLAGSAKRWPESPPRPWALPGAMAARNSACCCRTPIRPARWRSARWCARRSRTWRCRTHHQRHQTVTVSVGVASTKPNDSQRPGDLIEAADAALYAAKHRGRNAVVEHGFVRITDGSGSMALAS